MKYLSVFLWNLYSSEAMSRMRQSLSKQCVRPYMSNNVPVCTGASKEPCGCHMELDIELSWLFPLYYVVVVVFFSFSFVMRLMAKLVSVCVRMREIGASFEYEWNRRRPRRRRGRGVGGSSLMKCQPEAHSQVLGFGRRFDHFLLRSFGSSTNRHMDGTNYSEGELGQQPPKTKTRTSKPAATKTTTTTTSPTLTPATASEARGKSKLEAGGWSISISWPDRFFIAHYVWPSSIVEYTWVVAGRVLIHHSRLLPPCLAT